MIKEIEQAEKYINCNEHLRNNIDKFKEVFIKYYGEEKREEIEATFSKALFVAFQTPSTIESSIRKIQEAKTEEIIEKALGEDSTFTLEDITDKTSFENKNIMPINNYADFIRDFNMSPEERHNAYVERSYQEITRTLPEMTREEFNGMVESGQIPKKYDVVKPWVRNNLEFLIDPNTEKAQYEKKFDKAKKILDKIDPDMTLETFSYYVDDSRVQELNRLAEAYPEMVREYEEYMTKYKSILEEIKRNQRRRTAISDKYYQELVKANLDLIPEDKRSGLEEYYAHPDRRYMLDRYVTETFGYSLMNGGSLEAFTTASEEILKTSDQDWKLKNIRDKRIEYFKSRGIDLGDDYTAYEESEEVRKIWPTCERTDQFINSRNEMLNKSNIEYYTGTKFYQQIRSEIDEHHLLDKEDSFNAELFAIPGTFVNPNIVKTEDGYDMFSLLIVSCETDDGAIDHNIIHELNHLYELSLKSVEGNEYEGLCGWDTLQGSINQSEIEEVNTLEKRKDKRPYELFNEIINEIIAQEICGVLREEGLYIFDTKEKARDKHVTSYESTFFLVKDFYSEFKDKIIASRRNGQIHLIWDEVGKENFDALNDLFAVFNDNFAGFKYYNLLDDLRGNKETSRTEIYYDLIRQRDEILERMRTHSMTREASVNEVQAEAPTKK